MQLSLKILVQSSLLFGLLLSLADSLDVDCGYDSYRNMVSCRCVGSDRDESGREDLSDIISGFASRDRFRNLHFRHVEVRDCRTLKVTVDLRAFVVDGRVQSISDISFENIDDLDVYVEDIDFGNKRFVFEDVRYLKLGGQLEHESTSVRIFVRNDRSLRSEVVFEDFLAKSQIPLINIQDTRVVRVIDSAFEHLHEAEVIRAERCHLGEESVEPVPCTREELFVSTVSFPTGLQQIASHPVFIAFVGLLILAILLGIFSLIYVKHWKKKKELELLGYPASTLSRSTPPQSRLSGRAASVGVGPAVHSSSHHQYHVK